MKSRTKKKTEQKAKLRVMVGTPSYDGKLLANYVDSLMKSKDLASTYGIEVLPIFICGDALVQRARNDIFKLAYESGVDKLFFIDSDMSWEPISFVRMVTQDLDVIVAPCRKKMDEEQYNISSPSIPSNEYGFYQIQAGGTGLMVIDKKVIESVYENSDEYSERHVNNRMVFDIGIVDGQLVSEDIMFCKKVNDLGFNIFVDMCTNVGHHGNKEYKGDFSKYVERLIENEKTTTKA